MRRIGVGDLRLSDKAKANVMDALSRNRLTYGPWQQEFEERFALIHGKRFACFVNSGTDALRIGLEALKEKNQWNDGWEIGVPALTFVATFNVVIQARMKPFLLDINLDDYGFKAQAVDHDTFPQGLMPVNLFGQVPASNRSLVDGYAGRTVMDSCETMFVPGCADGTVSAFSTYTAHLITTGVGGLVLTDDPDLARIIRSLANHGRSGIYTNIDQPLGKREVMAARFDFERLGYSSRGTEIQAAIGCAELDDWVANIAQRRRNAGRLRRGLASLPLHLPKWPTEDAAWMMFPIRTNTREERDLLITNLELSGIETRMLLPLTSQPYIRRYWRQKMSGYKDIDKVFGNAHIANETGFYIGCHQHLTEDDIDYVVATFKRFYA